MICSPPAKLKRIPGTKGFGNPIEARSSSALSSRKLRTSFWEARKLAKASASDGAGRGRILFGLFILEETLTGGSILLANQPPKRPATAGPRLNLPRLRARLAGSFMACRYTRLVVAR